MEDLAVYELTLDVVKKLQINGGTTAISLVDNRSLGLFDSRDKAIEMIEHLCREYATGPAKLIARSLFFDAYDAPCKNTPIENCFYQFVITEKFVN